MKKEIRMSFRFYTVISAAFFLLVFSCVPVRASVISGGEDAANLSAPADDPGWARVGRVGTSGNGSGVYLGSGWVLTANHVSDKMEFIVDGDTTYYRNGGEASGVRLHNAADTEDIDLYMFRVDVSVGNLAGLGDLQIASAVPSVNSQTVHMGTGEGQTSSTKTKWYVDTTPPTWVWGTSPFAGWDMNKYGYSWAGDSSRDTRWSYQDIHDRNYDFQDIGGHWMEGFTTDFEERSDYSMVADNDSGSSLFVKNGSVWELAGIAHAISTSKDQPSRTSMYGNLNLYSDLSAYSDQIGGVLAMPEPIPGDFDEDNDVDGVDFGIWQDNYPTASGATLGTGDADGDGDVDGVDFGIWQASYPTAATAPVAGSTIPEPTTLGLFLLGGLALLPRRRNKG